LGLELLPAAAGAADVRRGSSATERQADNYESESHEGGGKGLEGAVHRVLLARYVVWCHDDYDRISSPCATHFG
jgi:hypothetical protein